MIEETFIHREQGKKWKLPKIINVPKPGTSTGMFDKKHFYKVLGYRKVKKGEYFVSGAWPPDAFLAENDLSEVYLVIKLEEQAVQETIWVRKGGT